MDQQILKSLKEKVHKLPMQPGVYIMRDKNGTVIYVGKAKKLKNRVSSYFRAIDHHLPKVYKMVQNVADFDYIVTDSEFEALVLECSLIKLHNPKYNILLKDDKGYSYIKITNEPFPRITLDRNHLDDGSEYIGPYMSGFVVNQTVDEVNRVFQLPTCTRRFPAEFGKGRPCLNYHMKLCMGLCRGKITQDEYAEIITQAKDYIRDGGGEIIDRLTQEMERCAENLEFEKAARYRDRIAALRKIGDRQKVIFSKVENQDVLGFVTSDKNSVCSMLVFRGGRLVDKQDFLLGEPFALDEMRREFLAQYYTSPDRIPPVITLDGEAADQELLAGLLTDRLGRKVTIHVPQRGEQARLVEMALKNCAQTLSHETDKTGREIAALDELAKTLGLATPPSYIEAYDISNFGSSTKVAGMVVFENGKPLRSAYKRFRIKSVEGTDDYASMQEVIGRRLAEYQEKKDTGKGFGRLPDLILLDGGQGHLNAVQPILRAFGLDIPMYGMVKDDRHRTRPIASDGGETSIAAHKRAFQLVTAIQDEVHRYSITYSRSAHRKSGLESTLNGIPGIGKTRAAALYRHFKTIKAISAASEEELLAAPGMTRPAAKAVYDFYHAAPELPENKGGGISDL